MTVKSPHLPARILKVYIEPLTMLRHLVHFVSTTHCSLKAAFLETAANAEEWVGCPFQKQERGKEPPVAQIQLAGQLAVTVLLITSSNKQEFLFCHTVFYKLLAISLSLNMQELGVLTPAQ